MTDSSAWLIWTQLPPAKRSQLMKLLFAPSGAHMSFLRVPIGASDYTADGVPYSYDDQPPGQTDPRLADFSVAHDEPYVLPALRAARQLNPQVYLEGVPWSAPRWMKANDALDNAEHMGTLLPRDYGAFGRYLAEFVRAYRKHGVQVRGIGVQDEPNEPNPYPGMQISPSQEADLVARDIQPALRGAGLSTNVFGWDLSWGPPKAVAPLVSDAESGALSGLAWHCYDGTPQFMSSSHAIVPRAVQIVDECSTGSKDVFPTSELLISSTPQLGERCRLVEPRARSAGRAGAVAGLRLRRLHRGGERRPPDPAVHAQPRLLRARPVQSLHRPRRGPNLQPAFRLVPAGWSRAVPDDDQSGLDDVAFLDPDGTRVVFAYNTAKIPITFAMRWHRSVLTYRIPRGATTTLRWR